MQEISGKTELPDSDQTGHHLHNQHGGSVFISTKDYQLGGNEDLEVSKESSMERTFLFRS